MTWDGANCDRNVELVEKFMLMCFSRKGFVDSSNNVYISYDCFSIIYLSRFFDRWAHETTYAYIGNKHFFTKACHHQTYQNSKISWQKMPISDFQSEFSMSKIIRIFIIFFFIDEYQFRGTYIVIGIFWKLQFLKPFISKIKHIFCQLILEFW